MSRRDEQLSNINSQSAVLGTMQRVILGFLGGRVERMMEPQPQISQSRSRMGLVQDPNFEFGFLSHAEQQFADELRGAANTVNGQQANIAPSASFRPAASGAVRSLELNSLQSQSNLSSSSNSFAAAGGSGAFISPDQQELFNEFLRAQSAGRLPSHLSVGAGRQSPSPGAQAGGLQSSSTTPPSDRLSSAFPLGN